MRFQTEFGNEGGQLRRAFSVGRKAVHLLAGAATFLVLDDSNKKLSGAEEFVVVEIELADPLDPRQEKFA